MNITKENLIQFAKSNTLDDSLMKLEKDGIIYIYEIQGGGNYKQTGKADMIGLVINDTLYGINLSCRNIDKDFRKEVEVFVDKYNKAYAEYISQYTINNLAPVTDYTERDKRSIEARLNEYKQYYLYDDAVRKFFENMDNEEQCDTREYRYDEFEEFASLFIEYLKRGEDFLSEYIRTQAEINAEIINLNILKEAERLKLTEEILKDDSFMKRVDIYKVLKSEAGNTVRLTLDIDGTVFDKLKIGTDELCRAMKYTKGEISDYFFTANEREAIRCAWKHCKSYEGRITVDNIINITYGKKEIWRNS